MPTASHQGPCRHSRQGGCRAPRTSGPLGSGHEALCPEGVTRSQSFLPPSPGLSSLGLPAPSPGPKMGDSCEERLEGRGREVNTGAGDATQAPAALLGSQAGRNHRQSNPLAAGGSRLSHPAPKMVAGHGGHRGQEKGGRKARLRGGPAGQRPSNRSALSWAHGEQLHILSCSVSGTLTSPVPGAWPGAPRRQLSWQKLPSICTELQTWEGLRAERRVESLGHSVRTR